MRIGILEILELDRDKLFGVLWQGGHFAAVEHDEFAIRHGLHQRLQLCLQHIDMPQGGDGLREVRDLGQSVHVLFDLAHNVGIEDALILQPFPDNQ